MKQKKGLQSIAVAILAHNEEKQIPRLIEMLKGADVDKIYFFDDNSDDNSIDIIYDISPSRWYIVYVPDYERFDTKKNYIHDKLKEFDWVLHIDADEKFDPFFLKNLRDIIQKAPKTLSLSLKRVNQPRGDNFPDYQTRLLKTDPDIEWRGEYHEKPFSKEKDKSLIDLALAHKGNVAEEGIYYCIILEEFPIIHLPRRTDIKRPWW